MRWELIEHGHEPPREKTRVAVSVPAPEAPEPTPEDEAFDELERRNAIARARLT